MHMCIPIFNWSASWFRSNIIPLVIHCQHCSTVKFCFLQDLCFSWKRERDVIWNLLELYQYQKYKVIRTSLLFFKAILGSDITENFILYSLVMVWLVSNSNQAIMPMQYIPIFLLFRAFSSFLSSLFLIFDQSSNISFQFDGTET